MRRLGAIRVRVFFDSKPCSPSIQKTKPKSRPSVEARCKLSVNPSRNYKNRAMNRNNASIIILMATVASLFGCAQYQWQKQGASQQVLDKDLYECEIEAAKAYPVAMVTQQLIPAREGPTKTNCTTVSGRTECTTTPGKHEMPLNQTLDVNSSNRTNSTKSCMILRGYQAVLVK